MLSLDDVNKFIDDFDESGLQVSSVAAQTGTGKSTMFPEGFFRRSKTIFVVQPTITASTGLAKYMKTRIPENAIGTAVEGDVQYKNSYLYSHHNTTTPVVYCTAGHLRNILLRFAEKKEGKAFVDYIFLDEAHTGDLQYDGIMYVYYYLMRLNIELPKLILITATPGVYPFPESEVFKASYPGRESYPVEIIYHNRDFGNLKGKDYTDIFDEVVKIVVKYHLENPVDEYSNDGWVIFCPGKNEIKKVVEDLREKTKNTIIIPLYSSMTEDTNIQYDMVPPNGMRKIVVSTNVAEASITIEGLSFVFDTLVEKITVQNRNGGIMLTPVNISKSSAKQRKGRTGRTRPGKCYRMCTEDYFETKLEEVRKREIERIAPDGFILDLLSRKLDIEDIVTDNVIPMKVLKDSKTRLSTIGLIDNSQTEVTLSGEWIKKTPLSPRSGQFFWLWAKYAEYNTYIGAVLTSVLETHNGGYFYVGETDPPVEDIIVNKFKHSYNRLISSEYKNPFVFNIALILEILKNFKTIDIPSKELKVFCGENNLNNAKVKECIKTIKYLTLKESRILPIKVGDFDIDSEVEKAEPFLYQCFSDQTYVFALDKRHKIKSEIDNLLTPKDKIPNSYVVIPLGQFETEYKTFVNMYHTVKSPSNFKISIVRN